MEFVITALGTIICPRCGAVESGLLDLLCDECDLPPWDSATLEKALKTLASQQANPADIEQSCDCDLPSGSEFAIHCSHCGGVCR